MASSIKLKTIASLAQVSISSVSRVLSNKGYVSPDAREKVLNALAELTAQDTSGSIKSPQPSLFVGVFLHRESFVDRDPKTSVDVTTLLKVFENKGHAVTLYDMESEDDRESVHAAHKKGRLQAAIVHDDDTSSTSGRFLDDLGVPWIATNGHDRDLCRHFADNDNFGGSRALIRHLLDQGHLKTGVITGDPGRWVSENRLEACRREYRDRGLVFDEKWIQPGFFKLTGGFEACNILLDRVPDLTAIYAFNDLSAIGAIRALRDRNLRVPEDISVVGFDDMEIAAFSDPPLTTATRFNPDINNFLLQGVEDLVYYQGVASFQIYTDSRIVLRKSSAKNMRK